MRAREICSLVFEIALAAMNMLATFCAVFAVFLNISGARHEIRDFGKANQRAKNQVLRATVKGKMVREDKCLSAS